MKETEEGYFEKGAFYPKENTAILEVGEEKFLARNISLKWSIDGAEAKEIYDALFEEEETINPESEYVEVARYQNKRYKDALTFIQTVAGIGAFLAFLLILLQGGYGAVVGLAVVVWIGLYICEEL